MNREKIRVKVKLGPPLTRLARTSLITVELDGSMPSVADLLQALEQRYPGFKTALDQPDLPTPVGFQPYNLFVRDRLVRLSDATRVILSDGDKVYIFLAIGGG